MGAVVVVVTLAAIGLLTACLYGVAAPLLANVLASPPTVSPAATSAASTSIVQATAAETATPGNKDWDTFTVYDGGFRIDVPGVLGSSHGYFINDFSGQSVDLSYNGATLSTPLQRLEAGVKMSRCSTRPRSPTSISAHRAELLFRRALEVQRFLRGSEIRVIRCS